MKIYTRTGDLGQTSLASGQRASKGCNRLESYGTIDELNAWIGVLLTSTTDNADRTFLTTVQKRLFTVGANLASDTPASQMPSSRTITATMVTEVESEIDRLTALLPPLRSFILPGGSTGAAWAGICRTVCRRAERCITRLQAEGADIDPVLTSYVNRLSDYFFVLGRKNNADSKIGDIIWK